MIVARFPFLTARLCRVRAGRTETTA